MNHDEFVRAGLDLAQTVIELREAQRRARRWSEPTDRALVDALAIRCERQALALRELAGEPLVSELPGDTYPAPIAPVAIDWAAS